MNYTWSGKIFTDLIFLVFQANGELIAVGNELTKKHGLTSSRWQVLGPIEEKPKSVSEIAKAMGLTRQSVQRTADLLIREGICEMQVNPNHKKSNLLRLTKMGAAKMRAMGEIQTAWANNMASGFSTKELVIAVTLLEKLMSKLREEI